MQWVALAFSHEGLSTGARRQSGGRRLLEACPRGRAAQCSPASRPVRGNRRPRRHPSDGPARTRRPPSHPRTHAPPPTNHAPPGAWNLLRDRPPPGSYRQVLNDPSRHRERRKVGIHAAVRTQSPHRVTRAHQIRPASCRAMALTGGHSGGVSAARNEGSTEDGNSAGQEHRGLGSGRAHRVSFGISPCPLLPRGSTNASVARCLRKRSRLGVVRRLRAVTLRPVSAGRRLNSDDA